MKRMRPLSEWSPQELDLAIALKEREDRRALAKQMAEVAARLAAALPPRTRREAAQLQSDMDLWEHWCRRGVEPLLPRRVKSVVLTPTTRKPRTERKKLGQVLERDPEWQQKGVPKRRVRCVIYEVVPLGDNDVGEIDGVNRLIAHCDDEES
jgi:hypothetical protein